MSRANGLTMARSERSRGLSTRGFTLLLGAILLGAGVMRCTELGAQGFWLDELFSMINSAGLRDEYAHLPKAVILEPAPNYTALREDSTFRSVWSSMRADCHPPLFFLILLEWRRWLGDDESSIRFLSCIFSVLSIVPVAFALRCLGRPRAGLIAALLLSVAFAHIRMAQENRPYALAMLLTSCGFWALVGMEKRQGQPSSPNQSAALCLLFAICAYLSLLTHYFSAPVLMAQGFYGLLRLRGRPLKWWLFSCGMGLFAFLLTWAPSIRAQWSFLMSQHWLAEDRPDHVVLTLARWSDLPMRLLLPHKTHLTDWRLSAAGIIVLLACIARMRRLKDSTSWLFLLWFAIPVVAIGLRDVTTQDCLLRNLRYVALAVPGIAGMIALLIDGFGPRMRWVLAAVLVATLFWQSEFPSGRNPQARLVGRILRERAAPDDLVVYSSVDLPPHWLDHLFLPASYYYPNSPHPTVLLSELPTVGFANTLREHRRIFVVSALLPRSSKIFPHTHEVTWESNFIYQFGKVYELTRKNLGPEP